MRTKSIVLAAGKGTRMRSNQPKVLHPMLGQSMVWYALEAARKATGTRPVLIVGYSADRVREVVGDAAEFVLQEPQLGTGHAVMQAENALKGKADLVLVTTADMPLLRSDTLEGVLQAHQTRTPPPAVTLLTLNSHQARGFGRIRRDPSGGVQAIVEESQATADELELTELNASVYCFSADWLWEALPRILVSSAGEYYLTDLIGLAVEDGLGVQALPVEDPTEVIGINDREHLAEAEGILRQRINRDWMLAGVTLVHPQTTYIEPGVEIGQDTVIWPNTYLHGSTSVGTGCKIGPNSILIDSRIGDGSKVLSSVLEGAILEENVEIGPFARLRKGAHLARGVHMGNFGEVKNSYLGPGTKMGHFSYVGDTTTGRNVNIGAGTVTCNYDGEHKYPTEIGEGAFIGSDTMLVAPVKVGEGASTGAGAVVTKDVPPNTLAVGMPARAIRKKEKRDRP
jgi:bifunctional UDP-N-acetylglucosamine pyrophosphorylase / glucosamine-1-phosphate N-acetyltransferase